MVFQDETRTHDRGVAKEISRTYGRTIGEPAILGEGAWSFQDSQGAIGIIRAQLLLRLRIHQAMHGCLLQDEEHGAGIF